MPLVVNPDIYRAVLESVPLGVYLVDRQRRIVFWNTAAERITGYLGQEVIGHSCHDNLLMHCDQDSAILCGSGCPMAHTMQDGQPREADVFLRHKEGQRIPVRVRAVPVRDEFGSVIGSAEFFERRPFAVEGIRDRRVHNRDTGGDTPWDLPDRAVMLEIVRTALQEFADSGESFGILCAAIDDLGRLRQGDGCQAVNAVVFAVGQTMAGSIRPSDAVAVWRKQDGWFVALISCAESAALVACAERLQRLVKLAAVPWWGDRLSVTVSMGGTLVRKDDTAETLIARASQALETVMAQGPGSVCVV
ncbi:MAG: PAS domain-containing protein [Bryobacteraceae bacterium]|jgi:PAS domain S-box-containing protein